MVSKLRVVSITTLALTVFFNGIPGFSKIESLVKRENNKPHIASTNIASAAERELEVAVEIEINKKRYSIKENNGKFLVYDNLDQFVEDKDIAQKAIFSRLVYDKEITPYFGKPLVLHTINFTRGELAQYAKNATALLLVGNYNLLKYAVVGTALFGPKGALVGGLYGLSKKGLIELAKLIIEHPGRIARQIGIETYKEGKRAWLRNVSLVKKLKKGEVLAYEDAEKFLYDEFQWMTLIDSSNHLTTDIAMEGYDTNPARHLANTTLSLMGGEAIDSYPKEDLIKEVSNILIQNLSQYEPYKKFIELNKRGTTAYIKRKIELDDQADSLIVAKLPIQIRKRIESEKIYRAGFENMSSELSLLSEVKKIIKGTNEEGTKYQTASDLVLSTDRKRVVFVSNSFHAGDKDPNNYQKSEWRDLAREVYIANVDGTNTKIITNNRVREFSPCWSADNKKIAYFSVIRGDEHTGKTVNINIVDLANNAHTTITLRHPELDKMDRRNFTSPAFSPDERKMAFHSYILEGKEEVYILDIGSKVLRKISEPSYGLGWYRPIAWSAEGKKLILAESHKEKKYHEMVVFKTISGESNDLEKVVRAYEKGILEVDKKTIVENMFLGPRTGKADLDKLVKDERMKSFLDRLILKMSPMDLDKEYVSDLRGCYIGPLDERYPKARVYVDVMEKDKKRGDKKFVMKSYFELKKVNDRWYVRGAAYPNYYFNDPVAVEKDKYGEIVEFFDGFLEGVKSKNQKDVLKRISPQFRSFAKMIRFNFDDFIKDVSIKDPYSANIYITEIRQIPWTETTYKYYIFVDTILKDKKSSKMLKVDSRVDLVHRDGKFEMIGLNEEKLFYRK